MHGWQRNVPKIDSLLKILHTLHKSFLDLTKLQISLLSIVSVMYMSHFIDLNHCLIFQLLPHVKTSKLLSLKLFRVCYYMVLDAGHLK